MEDDQGSLPLSGAGWQPHVVDALKKHGVNPTGLDEDNWSCVDYAMRLGRLELPTSATVEGGSRMAGAWVSNDAA